ncbi:hypothetical protein COT77_02160 [Candidatus Berkelbacteria bacterium CG10_big_fil_rev_8_21_14_0_10_41_12]|uniref:ABC transporter permease n=1 Tax=Candidatus Berkelbacteria bacterium CG10_big_fil_rev_8_21_14_0_10_41_12 TaxID=1974513 RepID=A0A2M6WX54_9BACT|nr:MAG: hypothetical protein COT77_02160 [Candidatus Berkelbacteria bacterium CG10_big_fil_rev_8_21_14_0_10_41_12]
MDKRFLIKLAFKNLMTHKLRTILTLTGVIIGISAIVFLVSFGYGIEKMVTKEVTGGNAFELIDVGTENSQIIELNDETIGKIKEITYIDKIEPIINAGAEAIKEDQKADAAIYGASAQYMDWAGIKVKWGETLKDETDSSVKYAVANTACTQFWGMSDPAQSIGREGKVDVVIPKELSTKGESETKKEQTFQIVGVINDSSSPQVYVNRKDFTDYGVNKYSQAKVQISDPNKADQVRKQIENMGFQTQYVGDTVAQIEEVFGIFKIVLASFGLIALIVAALGMFNTLTISLLERTKEVALLKILGTKKEDVSKIFLVEALAVGTVGGALGIILGYVLGIIANSILNHLAIQAGGEMIKVFAYPLTFLLGVFIFSFIVGLLTGLYPARRATKINALDVLRYE